MKFTVCSRPGSIPLGSEYPGMPVASRARSPSPTERFDPRTDHPAVLQRERLDVHAQQLRGDLRASSPAPRSPRCGSRSPRSPSGGWRTRRAPSRHRRYRRRSHGRPRARPRIDRPRSAPASSSCSAPSGAAPVQTEIRPERPIRTTAVSNGPRPVPLTPLAMPRPIYRPADKAADWRAGKSA